MSITRVAGVLLAAGRGERFGGDKLRVPVAVTMGGARAEMSMATVACRVLMSALPRTIAVVRLGDELLAAQLRSAGAEVVECETADEGMGASLACGVKAAADADAWVIALADMPWVAPASVAAVRDAIAAGAPIAAPFFGEMRGHPVGFSRQYYPDLVALSGDTGAQLVLRRYERGIQRIEVDDPGILQDVDTRLDLSRPKR